MINKNKKEEQDSAKEKLIKKETNRLKKIYKNIPEDKKNVIIGLIQRAAFMRVSLDEMEQDINENGFTEKFQQGNQAPYLRQRPIADLYNKMNASYQKIIKQLTDLLPREDVKKDEADPFGEFVFSRSEI